MAAVVGLDYDESVNGGLGMQSLKLLDKSGLTVGRFR